MKTLKVLLLATIFVSLSQFVNSQNITLPSGQTVTEAPWVKFSIQRGFEVFYNIQTNTVKLMEYNSGEDDGTQVVVTIYNNDKNGSIWKQFTLTPPDGYDRITGPEQIVQLYDPRVYVHATDDFFNDDDLVEVQVKGFKNNSWDSSTIIMNENNQVVINLGRLDFCKNAITANTDGCIYLSGGDGDYYILDKNDISGINAVTVDNNSGSVSPNPSNGAASVEVSWDYTLLDDAQLNVVDMDGKLVHTQAVKAGNRKTSLSTSRFSTGTYIYIVHSSNGYTSTGKFVIN